MLGCPSKVIDCSACQHYSDMFGARPPFYGSGRGSELVNFLCDHSGQCVSDRMSEVPKHACVRACVRVCLHTVCARVRGGGSEAVHACVCVCGSGLIKTGKYTLTQTQGTPDGAVKPYMHNMHTATHIYV